ncbi:Subtilisin-like serine protease (fragment) [Hyella patelloides LEGE 07179]|uniref:Subtilisin-like serine protease n=1 Tax=Hyella patelloides LEGE 07179 TaxID=945734 RepID=A0A563VZT8_9CYAN
MANSWFATDDAENDISVQSNSSSNQNLIQEEREFVGNELIVKLSTEMTPTEIGEFQEEMGVDISVIDTTQTLDIQLWEVEDVSVEEAIEVLSDDPRIEYVEPNFIGSYTETTPNDPRFDELWGLNNTGQTGGTSDADIDAPEAWDIQTGNDVIVGILDSGIDVNHIDLVDNLWTNPGEIAGNGIDDDNNGYVDDVNGYDFGNDDPDPEDNYVHGTHVAGTIAAQGNNNIGVTGVNWDAEIMMLKIGDFGPETFAAIQALEYGVLMGAQVTNNSWTVPDSQALREAIAAVGEEEQLFVAAAGNDFGNDNDLNPRYPASYDLDNIISVAATDDNDRLADFSNLGATSVDLGAPGVDILSTVPGNNYDFFSGTSMASPHVVGVVSLLLAEDPGLSAAEIKELILENTDPLPSLEGITVSGGRLNTSNALSEVRPPLEIVGTGGRDVLIGTNRRDIISGLGGNDVIEGLAGNDLISGGNGNDLIAAGNGNDTVTGNDGNDDITGGQGNDILDGNAGVDRILGESGDDTITGGTGNDSLNGGEDNDSVSGGGGSDRVLGGSGDDVLNGDVGRDTLTGGSGNDSLDGGASSDQLIGVDSLTGGTGEVDTLSGGGGRDTFVLGNADGVFYDDGDVLTRGEADFALVTDFNPRQDGIQLNGSAELYSLDFFTSEAGTIDADLIYDSGVAARGEVIATLQNVAPTLTLDDPAFTFV